MKKFTVWIALALLCLGALFTAGCGSDNGQKHIAMVFSHEPNRWTQGAQMRKEALEQEGIHADLYAFDTDESQTECLQKAVDSKPDCIVLAGGESKNFTKALADAKSRNIPIIDYDSLTADTDAINYFVTFDNYGVGEAMGKYIVKKMNLQAGAGPYNIEFFSGSDTDSNAKLMYQGAYDQLKPYLDNGQLRVPSGQSDYNSTATKNWDSKNAQARAEQLISQYYQGQNLDIIVAACDSIAYGVIDGMGAYQGSWPLISGQDADSKALEYIQQGKMGFSLKKDSVVLNQKCIRMIKAVVDGSQPDVNDVKTYNNGVITVPAYLCIPRIIDKENLADAK